jgi:hypothetical protein
MLLVFVSFCSLDFPLEDRHFFGVYLRGYDIRQKATLAANPSLPER